MKEKIKNNKHILIILIIAIIMSLPLLKSNTDVYFDDGIQHIGRAYETYLELQNNNNPKVLSNLANGFGYSWNLFYGPLSTILILIGNFITGIFINSYKLVLFIGILLSGITMYKFVSQLTKSKTVGTIAGILYMTMPYHLNDMYIRNALGEFLSYIFIPLVFWGMYKLFNKEKGEWILTVGAGGLILTHNLMTVITVIIAFIYLCVNIKKLKDKEILQKLVINIILIILISAFFWMPLLETYNFSEYEVYQKDGMSTKDLFINSGLEVKQLFTTSKHSTYVYEIGIHIIIILSLSIFVIKKVIKKEYKKEYILFLILGILSIFMSTKYFPWQIFGEKVLIIQFTWRMLVFSDFFFAIVCAINMDNLIKNISMSDVIIISIIAVLYCITLNRFVPINYEIPEIDKWNIGSVTENKNKVIVAMGKGEYLPVKSNKNRKYLIEREDTIEVLKGSAQIQSLEKNGQRLNSKVEIFKDNTILELPYIYYPGYKIKINNEEVKSFESPNGFLAISLNKLSEGVIKVNYEETTVMKSSKIMSIIGIILFIMYTNIKKIKVKFR